MDGCLWFIGKHKNLFSDKYLFFSKNDNAKLPYEGLEWKRHATDKASLDIQIHSKGIFSYKFVKILNNYEKKIYSKRDTI